MTTGLRSAHTMPVVPLIIRGHLIEDDPQEAGGLLAPPWNRIWTGSC